MFGLSAYTQKRKNPRSVRSQLPLRPIGAQSHVSNPPVVSKRMDQLPTRTRVLSLKTAALASSAWAPHCAAESSVRASGAGKTAPAGAAPAHARLATSRRALRLMDGIRAMMHVDLL